MAILIYSKINLLTSEEELAMEKSKKAFQKTEISEENRENLRRIFATLKRLENVMALANRKEYNTTEIRLMSEIVLAECEGRRLISTQIAKRLGITRSAVSQIVNKLEERGVICRVPDEVDRKIAYLEFSENSKDKMEEDVREYNALLNAVISRFGESKMEKMITLIDEFEKAVQGVIGEVGRE